MAFEQLGKYKVVGRIGRGAMGEVFKAFDPVLGREVAIKTISASLGSDNDLRQRFHREAQAAARLNHPNIITVFDYGEEQGTIYMAMELLEGADLRNLIGQEDLLPTLDDKLDIMEQICDGLAFAHSREVIHRDLKPGNLHVQPNGQVKILDFGLARLGGSEMTRTGTVMGTPHYMSPEQVLGDKVELSSDVFSIGAVFYELLSNHKPFDGDSAHAVLFQVVNKQPEPVRNWNPDLPAILIEVVETAMAKDRKKRYRNAGELREALALARRAIKEGRGASTLEAEAAAGLAAPKSAGDSFKSIPAKVGPPIPSNQQLAEGTVAVGSKPRSGPPAPSPTLATARPTVAPASLPAPAPAPSPPSSLPPKLPPRTVTSTAARPVRSTPASGPPRPATVRSSPLPIILGGILFVAAIGAGAYFLLPGIGGSASPTPSGSDSRVGALTNDLVFTHVELAKRDLDDKKYSSAIAQADGALKLSPGNPEARKIKEAAQTFLKDLDGAAAEAKARFDAGDMDAASAALGRVLAIDPTHPVAAELSAKLNRFFQSQAEEAQRDAARAKAQADKAQASSAPGFAQAVAAERDAQGLLAKGEFAVATQGFLEARDSFDRTRRSAEAQTRDATKATAEASPDRQQQSRRSTTPPPPTTLPPAAQARETPTPEPTKSVSLLPPRKSFVSGETVTRSGGQKKGPAGFDTEDVNVNPDFLCRIRFDPTPAAVRVGENYSLKIFLLNDGDKTIKIRDLALTTTTNGVRATRPATPPTREVSGRQALLLVDVTGVWEEGVTSWNLEASISSPKGDVCRNQVAWK
jgi:serine/threonine protein kinase